MHELKISPELIGQIVCNAARLDWGVGKVLRIERVEANGAPAHRVSVQFHTGHRTLLVPPARLITPGPAPTRETGWIEQLAGSTLDHRLRSLPGEIREHLGSALSKVQLLLPLYEEDPADMNFSRWAQRQAGVGDPLSHWSRDELETAFEVFCSARDAALREAAQRLRDPESEEAARRLIRALPRGQRERIAAIVPKLSG